MTGTPGISHARVLKIAVPIVAANVTVPLLGAVDTAVVGQIGEAAPIGAVGIGAIILTAVYWMFGFLRMGTTGLTSQALGAGDEREVQALLIRVLLTGFAGGFLLILLQVPVFWGAFQLAPASDEVENLARSYLGIRVFSAPAAIAFYGISGWLIAKERTRAVLVLQVWMNGINILLDLWFVLGLGWGVEGVALATFIAEWSGLALGLVICRAGLTRTALSDFERIFDVARLRHMLSVNVDILLRSALLEAAFVSFLFFGSAFSDLKLAANQILIQFLHVTAFAMDGFAFAAEVLVGRAMGARTRGELRRAAIITSQWGGMIVIILALAFAVFGTSIIAVMAAGDDVRAAAGSYLPWMVIAPLAGAAAWMFDGIFIGATRTRDLRNAMAWSFLVYVASVAVLVPLFENHGLWAALIVFFVARGVTLAMRYPALEAAAGQRAG